MGEAGRDSFDRLRRRPEVMARGDPIRDAACTHTASRILFAIVYLHSVCYTQSVSNTLIAVFCKQRSVLIINHKPFTLVPQTVCAHVTCGCVFMCV